MVNVLRKPCAMCGNIIEARDGRRKYCDSCRELRKHFFDRNAAADFRKRAREKHKMEKQMIADQTAEIARLRKVIAIQHARIQQLERAIL